jgi:hypothetical protein
VPDLRGLKFCTQLFLTPKQAENAPAGTPPPAAPEPPPELAKDVLAPPPAPPGAAGAAAPPGAARAAAPAGTPEDERHYAGQLLGAVMFQKKLSKDRQVLRVQSLQSAPDTVLQKIRTIAKMWEPIVNRTIKFVSSGYAEIRISFANSGSWSYIVTDALSIPADQPTMNFGWFNASTDDQEFRRTTVHEFGHALGMIHEHQHPLGNIPWDVNKVLAYYQQTQGWTPQEVWQQVLTPVSKTVLQYGLYHPKSIMHYPFPKELLTDPSRAVGWNTDYSSYDRLFMRYIYS